MIALLSAAGPAALNSISPEALRKIGEVAAETGSLPVKQQGWTPGTYALYAILVVLTPLVIAFLKFASTRQKLKDTADGSLRGDLLKEVGQLRRELRAEQADCVRRTTAMQNKMDAMIRQFVAFQIVVARSLPNEASTHAQAAAERLMGIIAQPVEDFAPPIEPDEGDGDPDQDLVDRIK